MATDIERWRREGNRPVTVEKTEREVIEAQHSLWGLWKKHRGEELDLAINKLPTIKGKETPDHIAAVTQELE